MAERTAYVDALHLLGRRELSVQQLRERLLDREHAREDVDRAIDLLLENKALDDARVAGAYVRTALKIKGRGRLRIQRELQMMGIGKEIAAAALAEAFGEVDERSLITKALDKKLRPPKKISTPAEYARIFQFLMRQGFSPGTVTAVLRRHRKGAALDDL
ncbi:MAG TPA: RecX family transcriptional regulator [Vicinamibacterales bacterium]|nr:RecX family transcriptional regulator [Vicinamibacterales bacterium]